jgi:PAT family beta-lactamase induction signal transducer AmpG
MPRLWTQRKIVSLALLGFASGLPLYLTTRTLQAWMRNEGVDLATIGVFGLVALPFSLKFLWAPVMDRYVPPFLGRRRGWLVITQIALMLAIAAMSLQDPRAGLQLLAINAVVIAFFSASQDVVGDAYRTDVLSEREMGAGAAVWVTGYRVALITTGALAFMLADRMPWPMVYLALSALMLVGIVAAVTAPEPVMQETPPQSFAEAVVLPFKEFFQRRGPGWGLLLLGFIVVYKLPDSLAGAIATPFLLDLGFSQSEIGVIQGGLGIAATIAGAVVGGQLVARTGINRSMWIFGALQALSNLAYYVLARVGQSHGMLVSAMLIESFCTGLVTAGFVAFMMSLCSQRFSATQYALISSLLGVSRDVVTAPVGAIAQATGWPTFFLVTVVAAIPGFALLPIFSPWTKEHPPFAAVRATEAEPAATP